MRTPAARVGLRYGHGGRITIATVQRTVLGSQSALDQQRPGAAERVEDDVGRLRLGEADHGPRHGRLQRGG
jgi:hypothetical protein